MKLSIAIVAALAVPAAAEPLTGNVLVWADALLYPDTNTAGQGVRVGTLDLGREKDVGYVVPMRVVGTKGDLVQVEPTTDVECVWWHLIKPDGLDTVRLFVKRADLAPVLTKPFKATYKDGSRIDLQPGVPVLAGKVAFHRGVVTVSIPDASIGLSYAPHKIAPVLKPDKKKFLLDEATPVTLGTATFPFGPWVAGAAEKRGARMLVPIAARCMTAVLSAPKERVHANIAINQGVLPDAMHAQLVPPKTAERHYLPTGTKLTSEAGDHVVGTLTAERDVKKPTGARACGEFVITRGDPFVDVPHTVDASRPHRTLKLCAPAAAVKTELK
jgi:hypothetical protein